MNTCLRQKTPQHLCLVRFAQNTVGSEYRKSPFFRHEKIFVTETLDENFSSKNFFTLNLSSRKNKKRNIDENFSQRKF